VRKRGNDFSEKGQSQKFLFPIFRKAEMEQICYLYGIIGKLKIIVMQTISAKIRVISGVFELARFLHF